MPADLATLERALRAADAAGDTAAATRLAYAYKQAQKGVDPMFWDTQGGVQSTNTSAATSAGLPTLQPSRASYDPTLHAKILARMAANAPAPARPTSQNPALGAIGDTAGHLFHGAAMAIPGAADLAINAFSGNLGPALSGARGYQPLSTMADQALHKYLGAGSEDMAPGGMGAEIAGGFMVPGAAIAKAKGLMGLAKAVPAMAAAGGATYGAQQLGLPPWAQLGVQVAASAASALATHKAAGLAGSAGQWITKAGRNNIAAGRVAPIADALGGNANPTQDFGVNGYLPSPLGATYGGKPVPLADAAAAAKAQITANANPHAQIANAQIGSRNNAVIHSAVEDMAGTRGIAPKDWAKGLPSDPLTQLRRTRRDNFQSTQDALEQTQISPFATGEAIDSLHQSSVDALPDVGSALNLLEKALVQHADDGGQVQASALHAMRKILAKSGDPQVLEVTRPLREAMEQDLGQVPGYAEALQQYAADSLPINTMRAARNILTAAGNKVDPLTGSPIVGQSSLSDVLNSAQVEHPKLASKLTPQGQQTLQNLLNARRSESMGMTGFSPDSAELSLPDVLSLIGQETGGYAGRLAGRTAGRFFSTPWSRDVQSRAAGMSSSALGADQAGQINALRQAAKANYANTLPYTLGASLFAQPQPDQTDPTIPFFAGQ